MKQKNYIRKGKSIRFLLVLLTFIGFSAQNSFAYDRQTDSLALVDLYNQFSDPDEWATNWLTTSMDHWYGITVTNNRVTAIHLYEYDIKSIPASICNMTALTILDISNSGLTGEIPSQIGNLTNLQHLYLYGNNLSGSIPSSIGNLSSLIEILLHENNLSGEIPTTIGSLSNLQVLYLCSNSLSGEIPTTISSLSNLRTLYLFNNSLNGEVPESIGNINVVKIQNNYFTFADLDPIKDNLSKVTYSPQYNIGTTTSISVPKYSNYTLAVPGYTSHEDDVFQWYKDGVAISSSTISGFSDDDEGVYYCKVTNSNFPSLTLTSNNITITTTNPYNISETELDALWAFWVSTGGYDGYWTTSTGWFDTDYTDVDDWYGIISYGGIYYIILNGNNLTGSIPPELGDLSNLQVLCLSNNNLTGSIPPELGDLLNLEWLELNSNNLTGSIPSELGNLSNLEDLCLAKNNLTGSIPPELGDLLNLECLALYENKLTGSIPSELGYLSSLTDLALWSNELTGSIPCQICNDFLLYDLRLYENNLTGVVPECLCSMPNLDWTISEIKYENDFDTNDLPSCWSTMKSATIIEEIDPTAIMEACMEEALNSDMEVKNFSNYIHNCMTEKMQAMQTTAATTVATVSTFKAYPNPAQTVLNIESPFDSYQATLFDFSGKKALEQQCCGKESLDVSSLRKGVYLLVVEAEGRQESQKISIE